MVGLIYMENKKRGDYFGEIAFFAEQERTASSKALTFSSLFILHKEDFVPIVHKFYSDKVIKIAMEYLIPQSGVLLFC